jgi:hypothetical protein
MGSGFITHFILSCHPYGPFLFADFSAVACSGIPIVLAILGRIEVE